MSEENPSHRENLNSSPEVEEKDSRLKQKIEQKLSEWNKEGELYILLGKSHEVNRDLREKLLAEYREQNKDLKIRIKNLGAKEFWPSYLYDLACEARIHPTCPDGVFAVMIFKAIKSDKTNP